MKILLIDHIGSFTKNIAEAWRAEGHEVIQQKTVLDGCPEGLDLIFCEWAWESAYELSLRELPCPLIVRLHRFELFSEPMFPSMINWKNVAALIFDNKFFERYTKNLLEKLGVKIKCPTYAVANGLNLDKWTFAERTPKKKPDVAFVGDLSWRKGIQLLCEVISRWPWATFHLTARQLTTGEACMLLEDFCKRMGFTDRVKLYPDVKNMDEWLEPMSFLLSTSFSESQGMAIAEAMAKGIKPLIYHFPGAETMYPKGLLWSTVHELNERKEEDYDSARYRILITEWGWTEENQMRQLNKIVAKIKTPTPARLAELETV